MALNVVAIALSGLALLTSTCLTVQQITLVRRSRHLPAYLSLFNEFRSLQLNDHIVYVCERLRSDHDPQLGIAGLPDDARRAVYDAAYFFQNYVNFVAMRGLDVLDDRVRASMDMRTLCVWESIASFVERERERRGAHGHNMMIILEDYARKVRKTLPGTRPQIS